MLYVHELACSDQAPGDEQTGVVDVRASLAQASVTIQGAYPCSKASAADFRTQLSVAIPQKTRSVQLGPSHQFCGLGCEERVSGLVDACVRVARRLGELGNDVGLGWFLE